MEKKEMTDDIWDFEEEEESHESKMARYNAPITKHDCSRDTACTKNIVSYYHEKEDLFDDFELSQRRREVMRGEIVRSRGRDNKERTLLKMFQSTADGSYVLRMQTSTLLTQERMGEITFETKDDLHEYYNYAITILEFDKGLKIVPDDDEKYEDLFASDNYDDVFEGLDDTSMDDLFDTEDDDKGLWD